MSFNLNELQDLKVYTILDNYVGKNPYIYRLKLAREKNRSTSFTTTQVDYIINNHQRDPIKVDKIIEITEYLGEELKKSEDVSFVPQKIMIEYILAETEKAVHVYGKIKRNQEKSKMYWLPKTQLLDDPYYEEPNVEVDFDKYVKLDKLDRTPYDHQKEGIKFLVSRKGAILGDLMGLGKTIQAIISALETGAERILIVCPASLKYNWKREIECFTDDVTVIEGKKWKLAKFTIINYDILKNFHTLKPKGKNEEFEFSSNFVDSKFDLVICDEAHFLKNPDSIRGKIMNEICNKYGVERTWLLTGTPIANRPMDFFNLLKLVKSPLADNWVHYAKRYCEGKKFFKKLKSGRTKQIWLTDGASNLDELYKRTKNNMLRRLTEDVLDMPDKLITPVFHQMSDTAWDKYHNLWDDYINKRKVEGKRTANLEKDLIELGILRQHMALENISNTIETATNAISEGRKVVIFCNFTEELLQLQQHFGKECVIHNGNMSATAKQASVDRFQNDDKIKVFIGNIISAGAGITLTKGTVCIFNSLDWVPGNVMQAIYRCYRIGQDQKVFIYFNIFKNTVDERVWDSLFSKSDIIAQAIGDKQDDNIFTQNQLNDDEVNKINDILDCK